MRDDGATARPLDGLVSYRVRRRWRGLARCLGLCAGPRAVFWHRFMRPPWGGGNQFLLALKRAVEATGVEVLDNETDASAEAHLINAVTFGIERFRAFAAARRPQRIVHRINGPIARYRGRDEGLDAACFAINAELATVTVAQSRYTLDAYADMGYRPVAPVVIPNAADPRLFHARGRSPFDPGRRVRVVSSSWSVNPLKGGPAYAWLDRNIDRDRFDYTFVGRLSEALGHARRLPPVAPRELADILRGCDIYVIASAHDPCSNALIEAMSCGLPVAYLDSGGHGELVKGGGLPFRRPEDLPDVLDRLIAGYAGFQAALAPPRLEDVAARYLDLLVPGRNEARG